MSALEEGAKYSSYKEFQAALAAFCRQTNSRFVVHDCKAIERFNNGRLMCDRLPLLLKYKYAKIACERFGQPRHEGRGIRNKGSKKNGCGAHVTLTARRTKVGCFLSVMRLVTKHSNQCEIRRKQKRMKMAAQGIYDEIPVPPRPRPRNTAANATAARKFQVKQERIEDDDTDYSDNSMQEYNYDVKPMVVYSDDEGEEQKPIPIYHLNENQVPPTSAEGTEGSQGSQASTVNDENVNEDVKPLPLADKPSLRALLLPAMALNFSQRAIQTET